jgi:hypothetical protein
MDGTFSKMLGPIFHDNRNLKIWNMATGDTFFNGLSQAAGKSY